KHVSYAIIMQMGNTIWSSFYVSPCESYVWRFFFMTTYHFFGIKGTCMSALAQILHDYGENEQESDVERHFFTKDALEDKNIPIFPFSESNIDDHLTIIAGNAFSDDHVEIKEAKRKGLTFYRYHEFLGEWLKQYTSIAVTGTHGKTS